MVAAPKNVAEATVPAAAQAAQAYIAKRTLWSPRTGLTEIFDDWKHETLMLLAALGFNSLEQWSATNKAVFLEMTVAHDVASEGALLSGALGAAIT